MNDQNISKDKRKSNGGFRLEIFNLFIIIFTVIITTVLSFVVYESQMTYQSFYDATEEYIACRTAAEDIHEASDYLTKQVRDFAYKSNLTSVDNYFREAKIHKRRETALEKINGYLSDNSKQKFLESAVQYSLQLMKIEYHSMRLVFEANGIDKALYPEEVSEVELTPTEIAMSNEEKLALAKELVQNNMYDSYKENIYDSVALYTKDLLEGTRKREQDNSALFTNYQHIQMILIFALISILMVNVAVTSIFLIRPLRKSSKLIVEQNSLPIKGSAEMQTFAELYNKVLEKTKIQQEKLSYEATHDSLTGIQNRSIFDEMYNSMRRTDNITLAIVDIDHFKMINDTYGHGIGDSLLIRIASVLHSSFRSDDIICRIGGDEFTVILSGTTAEKQKMIENKFIQITNALKATENDLPDTTLSIGVAFGSKDLSFKELYKNADKALYAVKSTTRNDIKFYTE